MNKIMLISLLAFAFLGVLKGFAFSYGYILDRMAPVLEKNEELNTFILTSVNVLFFVLFLYFFFFSLVSLSVLVKSIKGFTKEEVLESPYRGTYFTIFLFGISILSSIFLLIYGASFYLKGEVPPYFEYGLVIDFSSLMLSLIALFRNKLIRAAKKITSWYAFPEIKNKEDQEPAFNERLSFLGLPIGKYSFQKESSTQDLPFLSGNTLIVGEHGLSVSSLAVSQLMNTNGKGVFFGAESVFSEETSNKEAREVSVKEFIHQDIFPVEEKRILLTYSDYTDTEVSLSEIEILKEKIFSKSFFDVNIVLDSIYSSDESEKAYKDMFNELLAKNIEYQKRSIVITSIGETKRDMLEIIKSNLFDHVVIVKNNRIGADHTVSMYEPSGAKSMKPGSCLLFSKNLHLENFTPEDSFEI